MVHCSSCCGLMSLKKACMISGVVEIVLASIFLIINTVTLVEEIPLAIEERKNAIQLPDPYRFHAIRLTLCGINTCYWLACLFLGVILIIGAKSFSLMAMCFLLFVGIQRDIRRLRMWFVLTCILTVVFLVDILMEVFSLTAPVITVLSPTIGTIIQTYMIWLVWEFMEEVKGGCVGLVKNHIEGRE